jgi:hypothetical protein
LYLDTQLQNLLYRAVTALESGNIFGLEMNTEEMIRAIVKQNYIYQENWL